MGSNTSSGKLNPDSRRIVFSRTVDWLIGGLLGVVGLVVAFGGFLLRSGITRSEVSEALRDAEFESGELTRAETIDALVALGDWGGLGLVAAGALTTLLGVAVVVVHGRARRNDRGTPSWIVGVVGAVVASVLSFVPLSPVLGGVAAGYLDPDRRRNGVAVGSIAGAFGSLPIVVAAVVAGVGVFASVSSEVAVSVAIFVAVVVILSLVYYVLLSAVGGYLGGRFRE